MQVTTVCPAFINTGMFKGVSQPLLTPLLTPEKPLVTPLLTPEKVRAPPESPILNPVVAKVWAGMLDGTHIIRTPWTVLLSVFLRGLIPEP
ncbi:hypothetical protein T484DRAFT_1788515 [Baffinella frigidus]|nr:hypothetical protein T484DRAFT_1788515 [Cryptophyta sp. CCMP2293]